MTWLGLAAALRLCCRLRKAPSAGIRRVFVGAPWHVLEASPRQPRGLRIDGRRASRAIRKASACIALSFDPRRSSRTRLRRCAAWPASPPTAGFTSPRPTPPRARRHRRPCRAFPMPRRRRGSSRLSSGDDRRGCLRRGDRAAPMPTFRHRAVAPLVADRRQSVRARAVSRPDARLQGPGDAIARPVDEPRAGAARPRATIVGATSGDTGAAAIEAFGGPNQVDVFILYPDGRVSDVQRRQMTTVADDNIHVHRLDGTFDDAQSILKSLFRDSAYRDAPQPRRRQFDQLGARRRADGLLFHQRRRAWRAVSRGFVRRADRQFRRRAGGLCGETHGPALSRA